MSFRKFRCKRNSSFFSPTSLALSLTPYPSTPAGSSAERFACSPADFAFSWRKYFVRHHIEISFKVDSRAPKNVNSRRLGVKISALFSIFKVNSKSLDSREKKGTKIRSWMITQFWFRQLINIKAFSVPYASRRLSYPLLFRVSMAEKGFEFIHFVHIAIADRVFHFSTFFMDRPSMWVGGESDWLPSGLSVFLSQDLFVFIVTCCFANHDDVKAQLSWALVSENTLSWFRFELNSFHALKFPFTSTEQAQSMSHHISHNSHILCADKKHVSLHRTMSKGGRA